MIHRNGAGQSSSLGNVFCVEGAPKDAFFLGKKRDCEPSSTVGEQDKKGQDKKGTA